MTRDTLTNLTGATRRFVTTRAGALAAVGLLALPAIASAQAAPADYQLPAAGDFVDFKDFGTQVFKLATPIMGVGAGAGILFSYGGGFMGMLSKGGRKLMGSAR